MSTGNDISPADLKAVERLVKERRLDRAFLINQVRLRNDLATFDNAQAAIQMAIRTIGIFEVARRLKGPK
jgi:hypothetical protein